MTKLSGKSLIELESIVRLQPNELDMLLVVEKELLERRDRRLLQGKTEKRTSLRLREYVELQIQKLTSVLTYTPKERTTMSKSLTQPHKQRRNSKCGIKSESCAATSTLVAPQNSKPANRAKKKTFSPTHEQLQALEAFNTGDSLKINAFAGSGKTTTLSLIANEVPRSALYLAFNKASVADSDGRFGPHVKCKTIHGVAFQSVCRRFSRAKLTGKLNPHVILEHLDIEDCSVGGIQLNSVQMAGLVLATFRKFCHGREQSIKSIRVPLTGLLLDLRKKHERELNEVVHKHVELLWDRMQNPRYSLPLGHDGYLKLWALGQPKLSYNCIMLDEAQDTNDVVIDVLERQQCQIVYVGDKHQQIYEWRGAVNALDKLTALRECSLTQSFRFGPEIAELANSVLDKLGEKSRIVGNEKVTSEVGTVKCPDAILARSNGAVLSSVMKLIDNGKLPYVVGGTDDLKNLINGYYDLQQEGCSSTPEFYGFTSWDEVVDYSETEYGRELAVFVGLIKTYGPGPLWHTLKAVSKEKNDRTITVSTTHKAKGQEWDRVTMEDDFDPRDSEPHESNQQYSKEELRILYVALTRAIKQLQIGDKAKEILNF